MEATIRDLTDLSGIDEQLGEKTAPAVADLASLEKRRARLRKKIPGLLLASYDALSRAGRRPVVVPLQNAHCSGCRLRLPPQLDSSIRRHRTLCPCPYCHRLLYAPAAYAHAKQGDGPAHSHRVPKVKGAGSISVRGTPPPSKPEPRGKKTRGRNPRDLRPRSRTHRLSERAGADHVN
ncbi:MAG TPA: C4-type zinc ribbon domain-containing protein [Thermoanaerobaculia bacterium]|nr:C4-type zinc ribbon domain-containing protein [Thermoanaerobaculia bacterium]